MAWAVVGSTGGSLYTASKARKAGAKASRNKYENINN